MKLTVRIVAILAVVLVLLAVAGFLFIDSIARSTIEQATAYATDVEVTLDGADLGVTSGTLTLRGLTIGNPEGYDGDHFLTLDEGDMDVELSTVNRDTIQVPTVVLSGLSIVLEKKEGKANYEVILENLEKVSGEAPPEGEPSEAGSGVNIQTLRIEDITATIKGYPPFPATPVNVPAIELYHVPDGDQSPGTIAKVVGVVIASTLQAVATSIPGLPGDLTGALNEGLAGVGDLGAQAVEQVGEAAARAIDDAAGRATELVGETGGEAVEQAGEKAKQAVDENLDQARKKLGGLLGGGDDENAEGE